MALNHSIKNGIRALATTAITGASGTTQGLNSINMSANNVETGTLAAKATSTATTNGFTLSGKWQVSNDDSTFYDVALANNAAAVTIVTGTGSAVTATKVYEAPGAVYGWPYVRFAHLTGGATAGAGDEHSGSYSFRNKALQ